MSWLRWLWSFIKGFVPAALKAWLAERQRLGEVANKGAEEQRAADAEADAALGQEAKDRHDEISKLPDDKFAERRSRWVR